MKIEDKIEIATTLIFFGVLAIILTGSILFQANGELSLLLIEEFEDKSKIVYYYNTTRTNLDTILNGSGSIYNDNWLDISEKTARKMVTEQEPYIMDIKNLLIFSNENKEVP